MPTTTLTVSARRARTSLRRQAQFTPKHQDAVQAYNLLLQGVRAQYIQREHTLGKQAAGLWVQVCIYRLRGLQARLLDAERRLQWADKRKALAQRAKLGPKAMKPILVAHEQAQGDWHRAIEDRDDAALALKRAWESFGRTPGTVRVTVAG